MALPRPGTGPRSPFDVVVVAASRGGIKALSALLAELPPGFPAAVVVVQHRTSNSEVLAEILAHSTLLRVRTARVGDTCRPGVVYVTQPDVQAVVRDGRFAVLPGTDKCRADDLFASIADEYAGRSIAVVLTGGLRDGARGVQAIKAAGGRVLVQDHATSDDFGMPGAALSTGCFDFVLPLEAISRALVTLTMVPGAASLLRVPLPFWASTAYRHAEGTRA